MFIKILYKELPSVSAQAQPLCMCTVLSSRGYALSYRILLLAQRHKTDSCPPYGTVQTLRKRQVFGLASGQKQRNEPPHLEAMEQTGDNSHSMVEEHKDFLE